ncbi:preprotein translocase subunit YajC [Kribbella sp. VKM Ac-2527]|uniref:Preprotein translocase subunit YajC n=1 Tax=Kribbella caucasensis TaxID=2512215 RepID=A0A4V3CA88_9ACTN|nr:preprotein translocase subunit YajC [Kribbella sp. VKM Ac-2527]TDO48526.1 preprotein translocase subunit YajC [Kribbella sp. VKM Ac-2527]
MELIAAPMASSGGGSGITLLLPLILIVGMIWFMSRTQRKQRQRQADTVAALQPGTKVVTTSGMVGIVEEVDDDYVTLEISDGVLVQFAKAAIGRVIPDEVDDSTDEPAADDKVEDKVADDEAEDETPVADEARPTVDVPETGDSKAQGKPKLPPTHTES